MKIKKFNVIFLYSALRIRYSVSIFILLITAENSGQTGGEKLIDYVNPFIGTSNYGYTFPGAVVPWGMVSVSPHNAPGSPSGYVSGEKYFYGFGHTHLSGTGCADLGSIILTAAENFNFVSPDDYKTTYKNESAGPGYYSLFLDQLKLKAEATATARCGLTKFSSESPDSIIILFDLGRSLAIIGGGSVKILSDKKIEGYNISGGFCGEANRQTTYFSAEFNKPFSSKNIFIERKIITSDSASVKDSSLVCLFKFIISPDEPLLVKAGISYTGTPNSWLNLNAEMPGWDFEQVKNNAEKLWKENLSRIRVEGKNKNDKIKFYTALYHMLIHPNLINDVNGDYPLMGRKGIGNNKERNHYTVYSLWDTYRTLHPFLTLVYPERQSEMIKTMIDMYHQNGFLPKWELAGNETYMMVGDPAVPVISDSYIKGIMDFDVEAAYSAMLKPVLLSENEKAPPVRAGYHEFIGYKYIPFEQDRTEEWWVWGPVSTALEYCFSDWSIAQLSGVLNRENYYKLFLERSEYYRNLFDRQTLFMRPKLRNATWLTPFDSLTIEGSGDWAYSGGPGYVEGNAWNYTWFVPHDIPGLIELFGSEEKFSAKLLRSFTEKHFTINNEPDINYPYLFNYVKGKEHLTRDLVKQIMENNFGINENGLPGNDDCGTISGWFVFSALGFYPVCPASEFYHTGIPLFDKISIKLNENYYPGKELIILRESEAAGNIFLNEQEQNNLKLKHSDLTKGGTLIFR